MPKQGKHGTRFLCLEWSIGAHYCFASPFKVGLYVEVNKDVAGEGNPAPRPHQQAEGATETRVWLISRSSIKPR